MPPVAATVALSLLLLVALTRCLLSGCPPITLSIAPTGPGGAAALLQALALAAAPIAGLEAVPQASRSLPRLRQALAALTAGGLLAGGLLLGLAVLLAVAPQGQEEAGTSVIGGIATAVLGDGTGRLLVQLPLVALLVQAASVAVGAMPRIVSALARDRFLPRQFVSRGDPLVFSSPTVLLGAGSALALVATDADVATLTGLSVGSAGLALSLALLALSRRLGRQRHGSSVEGVLVLVAALGVIVVAAAGLTVAPVGSAVVLVILVVFPVAARSIRAHYGWTSRRLRAEHRGADLERPKGPLHVLLVADGAGEPTARAVSWARGAGASEVVAFLRGDEATTRRGLEEMGAEVELVVRTDGRRRTTRAHLADAVHERSSGAHGRVCVLLAETRPPRAGAAGIRRRYALPGRTRLLRATAAPVALLTAPIAGPGPYTVEDPVEHHVVVLVSAADTAARRCLAFARGLQATSVQALSIGLEPERTMALLADWEREALPVPLEVVHSPFRSIAASVRREVRVYEPDGRRTVVTCVLPEFVLERAWYEPLHNQTAALVRDALRRERGVVTVSIPIRIGARVGA